MWYPTFSGLEVRSWPASFVAFVFGDILILVSAGLLLLLLWLRWRPLLPPAGDETDELGGGEWLLGSMSENIKDVINETLSKN